MSDLLLQKWKCTPADWNVSDPGEWFWQVGETKAAAALAFVESIEPDDGVRGVLVWDGVLVERHIVRVRVIVSTDHLGVADAAPLERIPEWRCGARQIREVTDNPPRCTRPEGHTGNHNFETGPGSWDHEGRRCDPRPEPDRDWQLTAARVDLVRHMWDMGYPYNCAVRINCGDGECAMGTPCESCPCQFPHWGGTE